MPSDLELLHAWSAGDSEAGRQLFERYFAGLRRFFRGKVAEEAESDDLIQRTLLVAVERADQLSESGRVRSYLYAVARNELFAHYRRQRRMPEGFDSQQVSAQDLVPSPSGLIARRQDERALLAALRGLPLDLQITLELYYWEGMPTAELGATMGVPQSTATTRLARARELLRRALALTPTPPETEGDLDRWLHSIRDRIDRD